MVGDLKVLTELVDNDDPCYVIVMVRIRFARCLLFDCCFFCITAHSRPAMCWTDRPGFGCDRSVRIYLQFITCTYIVTVLVMVCCCRDHSVFAAIVLFLGYFPVLHRARYSPFFLQKKTARTCENHLEPKSVNTSFSSLIPVKQVRQGSSFRRQLIFDMAEAEASFAS